MRHTDDTFIMSRPDRISVRGNIECLGFACSVVFHTMIFEGYHMTEHANPRSCDALVFMLGSMMKTKTNCKSKPMIESYDIYST